jgi:hypothetical protein
MLSYLYLNNNLTIQILGMFVAHSKTNPIFCFWNQFNVHTLFYG